MTELGTRGFCGHLNRVAILIEMGVERVYMAVTFTCRRLLSMFIARYVA